MRQRASRRVPGGTTSEEFSVDWEAVGQAIGKEGEQMDGGVYRVNMPRSNLSVTSQDVDIKPGLALGSYVAFKETGENEALVMGDLVLTEDEYDEVISQLQEDGIDRADSIAFDPHKWLYTPHSGGSILVRDLAHLRQSFSIQIGRAHD